MSVEQHHRFALELLEPVFGPMVGTGKSVLDLGCGEGLQAEWFLENGFDVLATDLKEPSRDVPFVTADVELLYIKDEFDGTDESQLFDFVWSHHVLEHIFDPFSAICEVHRVLKPSGWFVCVVPDIDRVISNGHIHNYSVPLMLYHLAACGFDCSRAWYRQRRSHCDFVVPVANDDAGFELGLSRLAELGRLPVMAAKAVRVRGRFGPDDCPHVWPADGKFFNF